MRCANYYAIQRILAFGRSPTGTVNARSQRSQYVRATITMIVFRNEPTMIVFCSESTVSNEAAQNYCRDPLHYDAERVRTC